MFWLQPEVHKHKRVVFGWMNLLGALGGITNVIMILFNGTIKPINEHSYVLKAAKKLYLARSKDEDLFVKETDAKTDINARSKSA